ncbi:MAG: imidazole glycerol phosphate synthase subunit HisF [Acidobacteria bacterium]|nr:imidazole glycerol phosphate synthase subunit HisF [Acidobacteriota bacterium]
MSLKFRLIPCLLLKNGLIVRSELFKYHQIIGDPTTQLTRYNQWSVDELVYLDISQDDAYDVRRSDAKIQTAGKHTLLDIISEVSKVCFAPLTFGGRIRSIDDMRARFSCGADKITINTLAIENPESITEGARVFGSQAIVVSIDVKQHEDGSYEVYKGGRHSTGLDPVAWAQEAEACGAGEILLNSIDRDGTAQGYDLKLVRSVADATRIPVVALGGVGRWQHFIDVIREGGASAAAAANIFHFTEMSYKHAKNHMHQGGVDVRLPYVPPQAARG